MQPKRLNISGKNYEMLKNLASSSSFNVSPSKILAIHKLMDRFGFRLASLPEEKNTDFIYISDTELFGLDLKKINIPGFPACTKGRYIYATIN